MDNVELLFSDALGIYIPKAFAEACYRAEELSCGSEWEGATDEDIEILLAGPDHEHYWEAWDMVLQNATITIGEITFGLWQDGDLFAVNHDMPEDEAKEFFGEF